MPVTALTAAQRAAVTAPVNAGRLQSVVADEAKAKTFLRHADDALADLPNLTRPSTRYDLAHNAAHDVGESMLAAYGFRTSPGAGQHEALGRFLTAIFDAAPESVAAGHFETMRRDRNALRYRGHDPSSAAISAARTAAVDLHTAARARLAP